MSNSKIWLSSPHMGGTEIKYIQHAFDTNWIAPLGPNVDGFEHDLEKYLSQEVSVAALSSGTAALHLALIILGVKAGDEVICQSMTFSASANPIAYLGATPVFVDSEPATWNISPTFLRQAIEDRISKGKKPKAIIVVHLYGMPALIDEIVEISQHYQIPIIEDAAEALGSNFKNRPLGTFGDLAILSFNGNKIITTSGGGALVSQNKEWVKQARFLSTQARDPAPHYQHSQIGYNYRISNVLAGIGRGQMEVLAQRVSQRRFNFEYYKKALCELDEISFPDEPGNDFFSNRWLTTILFKSTDTRLKVYNKLNDLNIESRPLWKPMHQQPVFEKYPFYGHNICTDLFERGLCLPSGSNLKEEDLKKVIEGIFNAF